jgi:ABC-2 type transport system permease protein
VRSVWAVIRREYLQRVRSRWFVFATVGVPLLLVVATAVPVVLASRNEAAERTIVVLDRSGDIGSWVARALEKGGYVVEPATPIDEERVRRRVESGEVGGYLVVDRESLVAGHAKLVVNESPSAFRQLGIRQAVIQAALEFQLVGTGTDVDQILSGGSLEIERIAGSGGGMNDPAFAAAYAGSFVLYMVILLYAVAVMRSVLEEKTNRIVEVILSSLSPWQLMLGKILGVGAVGLTQLAVWVVVGGALMVLGLPALLAARPELTAITSGLPGPSFFVYFLIFFLGGYFIFSALYAAVGAMCNSDEEAQQAQFPVMILIFVPVVALVGVIESPNSTLSVVLSLIPFFSPFLMFARAVGGAAPFWQVALSIVLMVLTLLGVAWVAGRIYRVGILMTGKRPTVTELLRWLRQA